ncbi:chemotaxis protein CheB [Desulforhopalus vacuolatus]|uniref:chemotaxis protein CheB n=1 Tax=Desulforhopalus vacuolatus TaxID=40414 RepID=UPI0019632B81|nr:chemotaxis protein CheB [Desulforhopalus vacuolatus]MBM9520909.1 chemotaxis protein CheB [Desulforhopalus vacuolatus]
MEQEERVIKVPKEPSVFKDSAIKRLIVIASSAGGITALEKVISGLPADLPAAVIIVQHLQSDRLTHLPEYLERMSSLQVRLAWDGAVLKPGLAYLAMPGKHIRIENESLVLSSEEKVNYVRPSADTLFISASIAYGSSVIGVILTGTGKDGAAGCRKIKEKGGVIITQNEKTSLYFGMPGAAIKTNCVDYILDIKEIAGKIVEVVKGINIKYQ